MRLVFLGASQFGMRCLRTALAAPACEVAGVVTAPRTFSISYRPGGVTNVLHADAHEVCTAAEVPCVDLPAAGMKDEELFAQVKAWRPDAFIVAGWYHMVPKAWRALAPAYGLHASLLPHYRGGAPLVWAIIQGERQTGITLFQFDDGVDTGPVLAQASTPIAPEDTIATLYARIEEIGEGLLRDTLPRLADGTAVARAQDPAEGSSFPQRGPEDGLIDWTRPAARLYDFVRAQTKPYPGAFFLDRGTKVVVWSAGVATDTKVLPPLAPGEIRRIGNLVLAGAGAGTALELRQVQVEGRDMEATGRWA
ncbi:MAG TPA: methionyl-tRNA formyltransferase [Ramlibacter sp.]|jgi:methionyl-tRNA formyltransferase|nr:methionyl-tRNA formyltransferase [Ramlibacter sp.]